MTSFMPTAGEIARHALHRFQSDIEKGYIRVTKEHLLALQELEHSSGFSESSAQTEQQMKRMPYLIWAMISSSTKRARRRIVMRHLMIEKKSGVDIPPSVVHHVGRATVGHGFDEKVVMRAFADPLRTAADKTQTRLSDLRGVMKRINDDLEVFTALSAPIRDKVNQEWMASELYEQLNSALLFYYGVEVSGLIQWGRSGKRAEACL